MTAPATPPRGVDPAAVTTVLKALWAVWDEAALRMVRVVARYLARGADAPDWAVRKARDVLAVRSELERVTAGLVEVTPELAQAALVAAYELGAAAAARLGQQVIPTRPERVADLVVRLTSQLHGTIVPVIRTHTDLYRQVTTEVEALMQTSTLHRRDAIAMVVDRLLGHGLDRFEDRAGRRWHLDAYARMAGRTIAAQAAVEGQLDGLVARGRDLVVVSDGFRECPTCRPWEGALLSITGRTPAGTIVDGHRVRGTVADARAAGVWHPNCRHRADPYVVGLTRVPRPTRDPAGYEAEQQLRRLERRARELRRRLAAAEEIGAPATVRRLRAAIRAHSAAIAAHTERTGLLRRRDRERPVGP